MNEGWIIDCHLDNKSECMCLWIKMDDGEIRHIMIPWFFTIYVKGESHRLRELAGALSRPEYQRPFGPISLKLEKHRTSHESERKVEVLAVKLQKLSKIVKIAEIIDANGSWKNFEIFSVDPKISQRFLLDLKTHPFGRVRICGKRIIPLDTRNKVDWEFPPLRIVEIRVNCYDTNGKRKFDAPISSIKILDRGIINSEKQISYNLISEAYTCSAHMLNDFQKKMKEIDPDIVITYDGDSVDIPALIRLAQKSEMNLDISRNGSDSSPRTKERVDWSYGRLMRKEAYHPLEGRLHIDMKRSFIGKEGGIEGIMELARTSGLPAADLSRLSPGSAISAMQIRQSMEDGVLIPWKKNRPEDLKNADELILADRGGLYLDPIVGVHEGAIELDFASLFPSIIATRNISPETMNCSCCNPKIGNFEMKDGRLPLDVLAASYEIQKRVKNDEHRKLIAPELGLHVCTRKHGFLGRVVAPIIERRNSLKARRRKKGDSWDRRQNVLKWILVTCFGYTGYRNARFGRIECHEAICAWSREILLTTIEEANKEGWDCIHAIVDAIWIKDREDRSQEEKRKSYQRLIERIEALIGIPLELEYEYDWIAFIPNRTTGVGALTKYYAKIGDEWKVRGIELRQHSTCYWIRKLQENMLEDLANDPFGIGPEIAAQRLVAEISLMKRGEIPLEQLIVARRVRYEAGNHRVMNLTAGALLRSKELKQITPPGRKIHFAVTGWNRKNPVDRVRLKSEIEFSTDSISGEKGDTEFYTRLAVRAATAILSPFGWSEELLANDSMRQSSLDSWL